MKKADWTDVTSAKPCVICGKADWCTRNCTAVRCMRVKIAPTGWVAIKTDEGGGTTFKPEGEQQTGERVTHQAPMTETTERADADTCHEIYSALLAGLQLSPEHRDNLRDRGLSPEVIEAASYRTLNRDRWKAVDALILAGHAETLPAVPGFVWDKGKNRYSLKGSNGIAIPCRNVKGQIVAFKIRADEARGKNRYTYLSAKKHGGFSPGSPVHIPAGVQAPADVVRITEGEIKSDVCFARTGLPTISIPGVTNWRGALSVLRKLKCKTARLAFDADAKANPTVGQSLKDLAKALTAAGFAVELETWDIADAKGLDDLLAAGKTPEVLTGEDALHAIAGMAGADQAQEQPTDLLDQDKTVIEATLDHHIVNPLAVAAMVKDETLFHRGGSLVHVVRDKGSKDRGIERPAGTPRIVELSLALLRERMAGHVQFVRRKKTDQGERLVRVDVPSTCLAALHGRGQWDGWRPLEGFTNCPIFRPDGEILATPGYDQMTGLLFEPDRAYPTVPRNPTAADIRAAREALDEVVADFPFATPAHQAAALSFALTAIARHAFEGPAPLTAVDANTRGSGKSLLADAWGIVTTGLSLPRTTMPEDDAETRKRITAIVMAADPVVLIDNLGGALGGPSLDAALTGTIWKDRVLGTNKIFEGRLRTTWIATGNNLELRADTARRVVHVRLESPLENPEERAEFRHPNLLAWIRHERPRLLTAALTILRGFVAAGRPDQQLKPWGSFEEWSDLVRAAIVWAGWPDPADTRQELASRADRDAGATRALLTALRDFDPDGRGYTAAELLEELKSHDQGGSRDRVRNAIAEFCPGRGAELPNARSLGGRFRKVSNRVMGGLRLADVKHQGTSTWFVESVVPTKEVSLSQTKPLPSEIEPADEVENFMQS